MVKVKSWTETKKPRDNEKRWEENVEWFEFKNNKPVIIRPIGPTLILARHWIETTSGKNFPAWCPQFNGETETFDPSRPCPAHDDFDLKARTNYYFNAIVRSIQDRGDDNPVRMFELNYNLLKELQNIIDYIKCDPADPDRGIDLLLAYDANEKTVAKRWSIQRGERTPLTPVERKYNIFDFNDPDIGIPDFDDAEVAESHARQMKENMARQYWYVTKLPSGGFKSDINGAPWNSFPELVEADKEGKNPKAYTEQLQSKAKGGAKADDDEDEVPTRSTKTSKVTASSDDDDDFVPTRTEAKKTETKKPAASDDDEDDAPPVKKAEVKPAADEDDAPPVKKAETKKSVADDDDEDDAPPAKTKKPAASDDDDDDEDDAPPAKKTEAKPEVKAETKSETKSEDKSSATNKHPDPNMQYIKHNGVEVPECYGKYDGTKKCTKCPVRAKCINDTEE